MFAPFKSDFADFVCEGDSITAEFEGFTLRATVERDDTLDSPEERDEGFWPSLDPNSAGYIGPKSKRALARHTARAQAVLDAWKADEWFYCGVYVTVWMADVPLTGRYSNALWGIECNYPERRPRTRRNSYLRTVANELAAEALAEARNVVAVLCDCPSDTAPESASAGA